MSKDISEKARRALERQEKQYKRQNTFIAENYDRVSVTLPKGTKERIKAITGASVNGYINKLVSDDLLRLESGRPAAAVPASGDPEKETPGAAVDASGIEFEIPFG